MEIKGLENISPQMLSQEIKRGAKFVVFEFCISLLIVTFKQPSSIYFIRSDEGTFGKSIKFTIISLVLGWWGFPWGPIYTIAALVTNLRGGKDVTMEVMNAIESKPGHTTVI
ncbi:MAG: hypothetical protein R2747_15895 [Pyrinomonadaceae bacterium]